jgi:transglutaminase-like putative cysteine protease
MGAKTNLGWILFLAGTVAALADSPPDWLRLPAPGDARPAEVSAWILDNNLRVSQQDEETVTFRYRLAVMVLSNAGVQHGGFSIPFTSGSSSVASAHAWAMSPDGKKCREFGINDFVVSSLAVNNMVWDLTKAVSFEAQRYLQPGWILAWEVEIKSVSTAFDIHWSPRVNLPVRSAVLELIPMAGGFVKWKVFSGDMPVPSSFGHEGGLIWELSNIPGYGTDVPAAAERDSMQVRAYLLGSPAETRSWADVVNLARHEMDPKAVVTPELASLAAKLASTGDVWTRIEPICRFVQKEVSYLSLTIASDSMAGYRPHPAAEVCDNRYGDCKDKAVLLCTLLKSVGVESRVMLVNSGIRMANRADWPSANFNHAIVAIPCASAPPAGSTVVRVGGRDYLLFDPTDEHVPFGELPSGDTGGLGLVLAPGGSDAVIIPSIAADRVTVSSEIRTVMAEDGSAAIELSEKRFSLAASDAVARDETEPLFERTGALEKRIQRRLPLISSLSWESHEVLPSHDWVGTAKFSAQYVGKRMTGGMYVATDLLSVVPAAEPWYEASDGWVSIMPGVLTRTVWVTAPAGWAVAELPPDWNLKSPAGEGSVRYSTEAGVAKGEMRLKIQGGVLARDAYLEFRELLRAEVAAERRPVVLRKIKPAAAPAPAALDPRAR